MATKRTAPAGSGAGPGYAKGRATRQQILDEAVTTFGEVGYRAASLREIAQRCGLAHPTLLYHFPSKEALLLAVLQARDEADAARFALDKLRGVERLVRTVDIVEHNARRPEIVELYCILSAEATAVGHPAHSFFVRRYRAVVASIEAAFVEAAAAGQLRSPVDPRLAARRFVALMDGLQVQWLLEPTSVDMAAVLRTELADLLTNSDL